MAVQFLLLALILSVTVPAPVNSFTSPAPAVAVATTAFRRISFHKNNYHHHLVAPKLAAANSNSLDDSSNNNDGVLCTIQILMSDTGGGHRASANAIRDALDVLHPGKIECDIVDIFTDYGPVWPFNDYPRMYKIMAEYSFLWDWFYHFGATPFGLALNEFIMETMCLSAFSECLNRPSPKTKRRADMVVSVHPLCQDLPLKILASLDSKGATKEPDARTTPFVTVVTDLGGAHPTWFNPNVDKCFVPSDALRQLATNRNLTPTQILQYGLPIRKGFWSTSSNSNSKSNNKQALRTALNIDPDLPTVLMVGGGDGMGGIVDIAKSLGERLGADSTIGAVAAAASSEQSQSPQYQMVVVCGNNQKAKQRLQEFDFGTRVKVSVQGFVNNMDEWMQASDALVTKAGPGTIAEASICGLPCMLFSYLPGQEEGNVPFVENAGFGSYSGDPQVIAETVRGWLASSETMERLQTAALDAARPSATLDIARDIATMVFQARRRQEQQQPDLVRVSRKSA